MVEKPKQADDLLPHLFRVEYAKLTAVLSRMFGLKHIEIAEDIASETFLKAAELWGLNGLPENPTAWIYTVAKNKTRDFLKRNAVFEKIVRSEMQADGVLDEEPVIDFSEVHINDSQLQLIFAVCNSVNSEESQVCLVLKILCGFSIEEIANAFLAKPETIKKRLARAKENLRNENFKLRLLQPSEVTIRLDTVLACIYLLFNEGYFSRSNDKIVRIDLCAEAVRLALTLTADPLTDNPKSNALLALMCYQSSRLEARTNEYEETVLYEEQDKERWDQGLIDKGNHFLVKACSGTELTKYHLEASIAFWHTSATDDNKWLNILRLYNLLIQIEYSPITALNRTFAFAKVHGNEMAIKEAEKLELNSNPFYHSLMGYLYAGMSTSLAIHHYILAVDLTKSLAEKRTLTREIGRLRRAYNPAADDSRKDPTKII